MPNWIYWKPKYTTMKKWLHFPMCVKGIWEIDFSNWLMRSAINRVWLHTLMHPSLDVGNRIGCLPMSRTTTQYSLIPNRKKPDWWGLLCMGPFCATEFDLGYFLDFFLLRIFLTKTDGFLSRLKIMWVDRHVPTKNLEYGNTCWTLYGSLRH